MFASPSMSLLVAGVASGICFLIYNGILKGKSGSSHDDESRISLDGNRCSCCLRPLHLSRAVRCRDCGGKSCRKGCSRWDVTDKGWHCLFCRQQRYWLKKNQHESLAGPIEEEDLHRYFSTAKTRVYVAGVENAATSSGQSLAAEREAANTMETVRDFVEKIVEGLIGNLNDTPINRLYDHPAYKPSTDSPTMAHTALRDIVERAVDEARKLPGLGGSGATGTPRQRRNIAEDSYEDVLASAILNKVIEKFRKERVDGNSNVLQGKPVSTSKYTLSESEAGLDEGVEEGCSSLEPLSQDDCCSDCSASGSRRIRNQPEPLSLTIEERIEEVTTTYTSDEEHKENDVLAVRNTHRVPFPELGMDIIDFSQESEDSQDEPDTPSTKIGLVTPIESWEENWLFQRKRVQSQPDPVAMLVPNPSADFKALIGDKDAEDTSDLSDCSSAQSDEEIEKELMEAINNVVPRSPKGKEHDNGLDSYQSAGSKDLSFAENDGERNVSESERTDDESSCGKLRDRSGVNGCEENDTGEACERNSQENHREPGEETEGKKIAGKLDPSRVQVENATAEAFKEEENARRRTNAEFGEHGTENTRRGRESFDQPRKNRSIENDSSKSNRSDQFSMLARDEENVQDVPRTPTSTPTRSSVTEIRPEDGNDERDVNVLNSLECAKKKLMAVNDDTAEVFITGEETGSGQQKADFHAEDIQQESEYTEHYDIATQRHLDSLTKTEWVEPADDKESKCREAAAQAKAVSASHVSLPTKKSEEDVRLATPPRPGSIAEREHKKWENAPPIENNPYSQENIQKRLWERQYSRRPSDIPGNHNELPKSNGEDLDAMLAAHEPDIKRFGRDYYINESKASGNERGRRSAASSTSRPSSSLSQRSSSTGIGDQDPQEECQYRETETLLNRNNDVKSKVAKWQSNNNNNNNNSSHKNNQQNGKYRSQTRQSVEAGDEIHAESMEKFARRRIIGNERSWEDQRLEEMLENERKNNKNAVNVKLNNQESYENTVLVANKFHASSESQRKINRIDLKAYGFENDFLSSKSIKTSAPRVVNKLDLRSFGYEQGIRRTQSNIQLNSIDGDEFKARYFRLANKSNLTRRRNNYEEDHGDANDAGGAAGDNILTQSTDTLNTLNKYDGDGYNEYRLKSAKSVPNIAKFYAANGTGHGDEEAECYGQNTYNDFPMIKNGSVRSIANIYSVDKCHAKSSDSSMDEIDDSEIDTDTSSEKDQSQHSLSDAKKKSLSDEEYDNKVLPMPSVRRLAEAFSKQSENLANVSKVSKSGNAGKERSSTPEIQIVETPRQMHSLTARSLSKQFREGLKQIPNKVTSPPASHVAMEQPKNIEENIQTDVVQAKTDNSSNDIGVILPGKLKSNIIFWEQMQKKN